MEKRIVTVFGGSGFIGRHLMRRLAAAGWRVRVAVRDPEAANFLKPLGDVGQIVPWAADIGRPDTVAAAVAGATAVVNLVGILYERGKRTFERVHVDGARTVAEAAAKAGVKRLIHISAIGADENSAAAYARSKAKGEATVRAAFPDATVFRPSVVFGPEDGFFNLFAGIARWSPVLPVFGCPLLPRLESNPKGLLPFRLDWYGDGGTKFQPVYVGDVADAIMAALKDDKAMGRTYELGGPRTMSFKQVMELLQAQTGRKRILVPVPFAVGMIEAFFLQLLPKPLLTVDQVKLLKTDNEVSPGAAGLADLGVAPTPAEAILPTYLSRFRLPSRRNAMTA